jgi:antitoxin CcdA
MGKVELRLEIDAELRAEAEALGVQFDQALEDGVKAAMHDERERLMGSFDFARDKRRNPAEAEAAARKWAEENAEAIRVHNERIETRGVWGRDLRRW